MWSYVSTSRQLRLRSRASNPWCQRRSVRIDLSLNPRKLFDQGRCSRLRSGPEVGCVRGGVWYPQNRIPDCCRNRDRPSLRGSAFCALTLPHWPKKVICCALSVGNNVFDYKLLAVNDLTASHGPMSWFVALNSSSQYQRHVEKVCNRRRVVNDAATHAFISSLEFSWQTEWQKHPVG